MDGKLRSGSDPANRADTWCRNKRASGRMKAIFLVLLWVFSIATTASAGTPGEVEVGGYLREATLHGFFGNSKKFSDYRGKPLIINVWASWCGPCRAEMGSLDRLARRYGGSNST